MELDLFIKQVAFIHWPVKVLSELAERDTGLMISCSVETRVRIQLVAVLALRELRCPEQRVGVGFVSR